jgi:stress response protein SCP2/uncharacterized protein involved in tellurium resistance
MTTVVRGQKVDLTPHVQLEVALAGEGRWLVQALDHSGQPIGGGPGLRPNGEASFQLDLAAVEARVARLRFLACKPVDGRCTVAAGGKAVLAFDFLAEDAAGAGALIVAEIYRRDGAWRFGAVGQGTEAPASPAGSAVRSLQAGERLALPGAQLRVELEARTAAGVAARLACLGLAADGRLAGTACYFLEDAPSALPGYQPPAGVGPGLRFDLAAVPAGVARWVIALLIEPPAGGSQLQQARLVLRGPDGAIATYQLEAPAAGIGLALLAGEIYWKGGWRFAARAEALPGGVAELFAAHGEATLGKHLRAAFGRAASPVLVRGQKVPLAPGLTHLTARVELEARAQQAFEVVALALDDLGRLPDDASFLHAGRKQLGGGGLAAVGSLLAHQATLKLELKRLPVHVRRLAFALVAVAPASTAQLARGAFVLEAAGQALARFDFTGEALGAGPAAVVAELYRKEDRWRVAAAAEVVGGGLAELLARAGRPWLVPGPRNRAPSFRALEANGASLSLDLHRGGAGGPLRLELVAEPVEGRRGLLGLAAGAPRLELGCMYLLTGGHRGVLQGERGEATRPPFLTLEGPRLQLHRPDEIAFALVFATTAGDLADVAPTLVLHDQQGGEVTLALGPAPAPGRRFLAMATLEAIEGELVVTRTGSFYADAAAADEAIALPELSFVPRRRR